MPSHLTRLLSLKGEGRGEGKGKGKGLYDTAAPRQGSDALTLPLQGEGPRSVAVTAAT